MTYTRTGRALRLASFDKRRFRAATFRRPCTPVSPHFAYLRKRRTQPPLHIRVARRRHYTRDEIIAESTRTPLGSPRASRMILPPVGSRLSREIPASSKARATRPKPRARPLVQASRDGHRSRCRVRPQSVLGWPPELLIPTRSPDPRASRGRCRRRANTLQDLHLRRAERGPGSPTGHPKSEDGHVRRWNRGAQRPGSTVWRVDATASDPTVARDPTATIFPCRTATASARGCDVSSVMKLPTKISSGDGGCWAASVRAMKSHLTARTGMGFFARTFRQPVGMVRRQVYARPRGSDNNSWPALEEPRNR